jgi:predicted glutamine amidotransferase
MSQFWGLTLNDDSMVECSLAPYAKQINLRTGDAASWGMSYYSRGELLQRVEPKERGEKLDVMEVSRGFRSDIVVMHTRMATVGPISHENIHPFRFKNWSFAHNGTLEGFDTYRSEITDMMPPFIKRGLAGDTDSEHLFHLFLSFLYDSGVLNRPDPGVSVICDALRRVIKTVDQFAISAGMECTDSSVVVSDGYSFIAGSRGVPVDYVLIEGVCDCTVCRPSIRPGHDDAEQVHHKDLRAVLARSGPRKEPPKDFKRLPDNTLLMVSGNHAVDFSPFT